MGLLGLLVPLLSLAALVGFVWLLVVAFRESTGWGLGVFFLSPIAAIVFAIKYWEESKKPFLIYMGSSVCGVFVVVALFASLGMQVAQELDAELARQDGSGGFQMPDAQTETFDDDLATGRPSEPSTDLRQDLARENPSADMPEAAATAMEDSSLAPLRIAGLLGSGNDTSMSAALELTTASTSKYEKISLRDARKHVGAPVRVKSRQGRVMRATLTRVQGDRFLFEKHLSAGTFGFEMRKSEINTLEVQTR